MFVYYYVRWKIKKKIVFINGNVNVLYAHCSGSNARACVVIVCVVYEVSVGSRPGPLVLSMNFIDGGSTIRVGYASMNAPQSQSSSSSSQSVVFRFAGA